MRYRMQDGTIVDTEKASRFWKEDTFWDGNNRCSVNTGSQWKHQMLYRSRKGRYYIEHVSAWQGSHPHCEWVSEHEAARWLILNNEELPEELAHLADEVTE